MATEINYVRRGDGEPLVLIHGIGSRWEMWSPVLDALAAERDVIALDVPGFGASPRPPAGTPAGITSMAVMVEEFFGSIGIERPHVAGNSMGGWLALELAKRGSVRSANGLSPAGFHNNPERAFELVSLIITRLGSKATRPLAPQIASTALGRKLAASSLMARPERVPAAEMVLNLQGVADATWFWANLWTLSKTRFSGGTAINVPVTIAWGERDHLLLPQQARRALAEIPSAHYVLLKGCGHVPTYDDPELVAKTILDGSATA